MTTRLRELNTPFVDLQTTASRRTARGAHGFALADLANDAATGHPRQRATVLQHSGGTFHAYLLPSTARLLMVAATVSWNGDWSPFDVVKVKLSVTDGTTSLPYTDATIPRSFKDDPLRPSLGTSRVDSMVRHVGYLDRVAMATAGLDPSLPWRLTLEVTCGTTVFCELLEVAELPRFRIDDGDDFGEFPQNYRGRGVIDDHLERIGATLDAAYLLNRRTYHALSLDEATPDVVTSATWAAIPGSQSASGGARTWHVRPRRILSGPQLTWGVRYLTTTGAGGDVRITTGAGTYTLALAGTSGVWADVLTGVGAFIDAEADTLSWEAQVSAGSLKFAAYLVADDPLL